jgi:hypothetical protein
MNPTKTAKQSRARVGDRSCHPCLLAFQRARCRDQLSSTANHQARSPPDIPIHTVTRRYIYRHQPFPTDLVTRKVFMDKRPTEHVRHSLEATMRMVRKSRWLCHMKFIQHQERIYAHNTSNHYTQHTNDDNNTNQPHRNYELSPLRSTDGHELLVSHTLHTRIRTVTKYKHSHRRLPLAHGTQQPKRHFSTPSPHPSQQQHQKQHQQTL